MFVLPWRRRAPLTAFTLAVLITACGTSTTASPATSRATPATSEVPAMSPPGSVTATLSGATSGMPDVSQSGSAAASPTNGMSGMDMAADPGRGLAATEGGYSFDLAKTTLPAGQQTTLPFRITKDGKPVTNYTVEQTKSLHLYLVRSDLTGYQHLHPQMAADGTWSVPLTVGAAGSYRAYADFVPAKAGKTLVLSRTITVPGASTTVALPPPTSTTMVDGYTVTLIGDVMARMSMPLTAVISLAGQPVADLQPYLDTYAHLTAFQEGTLAFTHLHPEQSPTAGSKAPPRLTFQAQFAAAGMYRLFVQFQIAGTLHTAAITLGVNG